MNPGSIYWSKAGQHGFVAGFNNATDLTGRNAMYFLKQPRGTKLFMAPDLLLNEGTTHASYQDNVSVFWSLLYVCVMYKSPGMRTDENKTMQDWFRNTISSSKKNIETDDGMWQALCVNEISDHYKPLIPSLTDYRRDLFKQNPFFSFFWQLSGALIGYTFEDRVHDKVIQTFNRHIRKLKPSEQIIRIAKKKD